VKDASEPVTEGGGASRGSKHRGRGGDGWERAFQPACIAALAFGFLDYRPLDNRHLRFAFPPSPPPPVRIEAIEEWNVVECNFLIIARARNDMRNSFILH